jgi:hypothetical protein
MLNFRRQFFYLKQKFFKFLLYQVFFHSKPASRLNIVCLCVESYKDASAGDGVSAEV